MMMADVDEHDEWFDRAAARKQGELLVIRASALGGCRQLLAYEIAYQKDPDKYPRSDLSSWLQEAMDESEALEQQSAELIVDKMNEGQSMKFVLLDPPDPARTTVIAGTNGVVVEGTGDYMLDFPSWDKPQLLEVKTVSEKTAEKMLAELKWIASGLRKWQDLDEDSLAFKYVWQMAAYADMYQVAIVSLGIAIKYKGGLTGEVHWMRFGRTRLPSHVEIRQRVDGIRHVIKAFQGQRCTHEAGVCPYAALCHRPVTVNVSDEMLGQLASLKKLRASATEEIKAIEADILERVVLAGGKAVSLDGGYELSGSIKEIPESEVKAYIRKAYSKRSLNIRKVKDAEDPDAV